MIDISKIRYGILLLLCVYREHARQYAPNILFVVGHNLTYKESWSCWLNVGVCSTSCGNGTQLRCNIPTDGGQDCMGDNTTRDYCNIRDCPGMLTLT